MASSSAPGSMLAELEAKLQGLKDQKAAELRKPKGTRDHDLLAELNQDFDRVQAAITALSCGASTQAGHVSVDVADGPVEMVDCETNEPSVKPFIVPRNWRGQLNVEAIEKSLSASQHILEGIVHGDRHGYPACKDGWTRTSYTNTPIQLQDEGYKFKDLIHKWALFGFGAIACIVLIIYYGVFNRSPGNPPAG